jgi:CRISPR-associated endonuclease Csn1
MFDATIYGLRGEGKATYRHEVDGVRARPLLNREVVAFADATAKSVKGLRHGELVDGKPKPYMGLWSRSNYCIEIERAADGKWMHQVIETYAAYQIAERDRREGTRRLRDRSRSKNGLSLVMRLVIDDAVIAEIDNQKLLLRVLKINSTGAITFVLHNETNIPARYAAKLAAQKAAKEGRAFDAAALDDNFFQRSISPASLRTFKARQVFVSPIGEINDPGFKE